MCIPKPTIMTYVYTKEYFHYFCIYPNLLYLLMDIRKLTQLLMYIPKLTIITYVYTKAYH